MHQGRSQNPVPEYRIQSPLGLQESVFWNLDDLIGKYGLAVLLLYQPVVCVSRRIYEEDYVVSVLAIFVRE